MRTLLAVFAVAAIAGFATGYAVSPSPARADKTVTYLSTGVVWDSYVARPDPLVPGGIYAEQCAHALTADGGIGPVICEGVNVGAASPVAVDTLAIVNNRGLPFWKTRQGL